MMNELFNKVVALDEMMNEASESGNMDAVDRYYEEQEQVMEEIERLGLRDEFDQFIESMN